MVEANPYPTYEDAARDFLAKLRTLMQLSHEVHMIQDRDAADLPSETLVQRAEEIADISSCMIQLARNRLETMDPTAREGIRGQFIDQATVELLFGTELLQIGEGNGLQSTAAARATHSAALREAISAMDKSLSAPAAQGLPTGESYRATESETIEEAASALSLTVASTTSGISRRVQELGRDIAFDLVSGARWSEVVQGASLSSKEIGKLLKSIQKDAGAPVGRTVRAAAKILFNVSEKIMALLDNNVQTAARGAIGDWLSQIKHAGQIELFDVMVENLFEMKELQKPLGIRIEPQGAALESINKTSDLLKTLSDKFMVLIGRMRKLEDAIRLGKLIKIPQLLVTITALQVVLLAALVYSGHDYINKELAGILRENGFLES